MKIRVAGLFNRSITIELDNNKPYSMDKHCTYYLNGNKVKESDRNVNTIDGLTPDMDYMLKVCGEDFCEEISFHTKRELCCIDVRSIGAKGDGVSNDTAFLQAAISACPEGGTVHITEGTYLSAPLFLKSNITIWLDEDAVLLGDPDRNHYPVLPGMVKEEYGFSKEISLASWEGNPISTFASLITGIGVSNVDFIGRGIIDGNAAASDWWDNVSKKRGAWRPKTVFLNNCSNIRFQGVTIKNSPSWTVHPYYSDKVSFYDMDITNPDNSPNTDGFDPESCTDVEIIGVRISVGDDCIAIKSGKMYMGINHNKPADNIVIRNCRLEHGHGSVTVGSEVASGVSRINISRCLFVETDRGLRIKTRRGRGERSVIDDVNLSDIRMENVRMPFTVNMFYFCDPDGHTSYVQDQEPRPVDERTPRIGRISAKNITCTGVNASLVCAYGLPERPIEELIFENIDAEFLPEAERKAECPIMMDGFEKMSGRSVYLRNVRKITINNVNIKGAANSAPELIDVAEENIKGLSYAEV